MKRLRLIVFCLNVVLLCHWHPVQHGHCSEQNKPRVQNITTADITELQSESQEDRKDDETVSSEPPASTSKPSSQTDAGPDGELRTLETGPQEKSEKAERTTAETEMTPEAGDPVLVPEQAVPEPSVPPDQAVLESSVPPDQSGPESSTHPEQDASSLSSVLPVLPAVLGTASQATHVLDSLSSQTTALSGLTPCPVADDSCPSASVSSVPSVAACDGGDSPPYNDILASGLPTVLENTSTSGAGKGTKGSLERTSQGTNASSRLDEQDVHAAMETDPAVPNKDVEDIPTFDEWKKIMMEVENEKSQTTHTSCNGGSSSVKKVQKTTNYASVECGAKILSSNPEAKSTSAILMENMDVYMLNPCSNKIWFVIELCQPIQLKQLDIANFELFSSTPKDFLVSISDRYPTSKWAKLGMFHARDERTIQSFPLDEHLYAKYVKMFTKYIKVELLSHFGSEHFCPLSLIRVFGTSMMEEYELNSEPSERLNFQDEDYDDPPRYAHSDDKTSKNLIGSAKDVILNMVNNIASNVLGGKSGGNYSSSDLNLTETSGTQTTSSISTSIMLQTLTVDQHNLDEITETPPITEDGDGDLAVAAPTISLSETPTAALAATESLNAEAPDEEQIITLLPKEEGEESEDQSEQQSGFVMQEEEQRVKAEGDRQVVRASVGCGELTPDSCSCVFSLQEHLLQKCFPAPPKRRKKETRKTEQQSPSQPSMHLQETQMPVLAGVSSSITRVLHTWTAEASSLPEASPTQTAIPPFPESSRKLEAGHLDLAPSLTSSLLDPASARTLSSRTSQTMGFLEPSANEPSDLQLPLQEQSQEKPRDVSKTSLLTSHSEPPSAPVLATKTDEAGHDPKPQSALEKPSAEKDTQQLSVVTSTVDQAPLSPLSTPTDQSSSQPATTRTAAATQTFTPMPVTAPSDSPRGEELLEEDQPGPLNPNEFYAEMLSTTDTPVHGSSQKESVFMRLNNRIKALEVNMSLSGRYLEQLSQRYRKQMEEMQKAFNKTIIKLQNTSRMAEEQDQKQTESIQVLQGQLDNVTQLLLNLSVRVSQLQREVSDRHGFLLLSVLLCMILGLLVCTSVCRVTAETIPPTDADVPLHNTYSYCCPEASHGYEDVSPKRRASYPLTQSSLQTPPTEGPHEAYNVETQRNLTRNKKRKRKMKCGGRPETITPTLLSVPNGVLPHYSSPPRDSATQPSLSRGLGPPPSSPLGDPLSEGSSEASSQSDEPSFCGIAPCSRLCEGLPPPMSRSQRRCYKRRRSKAGGSVVEQLLQPERWKGPSVGPGPSPHGFTGGSTG